MSAIDYLFGTKETEEGIGISVHGNEIPGGMTYGYQYNVPEFVNTIKR